MIAFLQRINYKRLNNVLLLFFFLLLEYSYYVYITDVYGDMYRFDFDIYRYIISKLIFAFLLLLINRIKTDLLYVISLVFMMIMLVPNLVIYQFMEFNLLIIFYISFFILLLALAGQIRIIHKYKLKLLPEDNSRKVIFLFALALLMLVPYFLTFKLNVDFSVFNLDDAVYQKRADSIRLSGAYVGYTRDWLAKILLPIVLIFSLKERYHLISIATVALMLYLFLILAHKAMLFAPFIIIFLYFFKDAKHQIAIMFLGVVSVVLLSRLLNAFFEISVFESLFVRRVFLIPAILNDFFIDFFKGNPQYFSNSFLGSFIDYEYNIDIKYIIGRNYLGKAHISANNGFIADGFVHLGYIGPIIFSIFVAGIFKLFDSLKINNRFNGIFILMAYVFLSTAFFTSFLSHGLAFLILMSYLVLHDTKKTMQ